MTFISFAQINNYNFTVTLTQAGDINNKIKCKLNFAKYAESTYFSTGSRVIISFFSVIGLGAKVPG